MKQDLVKKIPVLIPSAIKAIIGSTLHSATLHVLQGTPDNISFDLNGLVTARDNYELAKVSLTVTRNTFVLKTQMTRETIRIARDILKQYLGTEYNSNWDLLGLPAGSIAVPYTAEELYPAALGFKAHLAANPTRENVPLQITAANLQSLYDDLVAAQTAVLTDEESVLQLKELRDEKADRLYKRLRATIEELTLLMGPLDPRWKTFGFNMPGADETPEVPTNVTAILIGPTAAAIKWPASARAGYYRVWMKVHGSPNDYVAMGSPADLDFTLENLPAASTVDIVVSAVNNGGESQFSEVITITTH
jgi:hypothetical protein